MNFLNGLKEGMLHFGSIIGAVVNTILLSVVYFVGVGISFILGKILNKSFLEKNFLKKKSYWLSSSSKNNFYRQF